MFLVLACYFPEVFSIQYIPPCFEVDVVGGCWADEPAVVTFAGDRYKSSAVKGKVWI